MLKTLVATLHTVVMGSSLSQQSAIDTISLWRTKPAHELIFDSPRPDVYLQAVDKLQQQSNGGTNELLSIAVDRLKREFKAVLRNRQPEYPSAAGPSSTMEWPTTTTTVTDSTACLPRYEEYVGYDIPNRDVLVYLSNIVKIMKANGSVYECVDMYKSVRYKFLESQFKKLHFSELKIINADSLRRLLWRELEPKIYSWVRVSKICVEIFFRKEKLLCEEIFGKGSDSDSIFVETVRDFGVGLFGFAKVVSESNQRYDKMGAVLGLYGAFWSLLPDIEVLFGCESGRVIRDMCDDIRGMVQKEAGQMLEDLEKDALNEIIPNVGDDAAGGGVCKTTTFVMGLIDHVVKHRQMLKDLIKSGPTPDVLDGVGIQQADDLGDMSRNLSLLDLHLRLIIVALRRSARKKSNMYQDPSLAHLFMMNNMRYIVKKIEESPELRQMVGDSYLKDLNDTVESEMKGYCENTCSKFSDCLQEDGLYVIRCFRSCLSKPTMRKRLKTFNAAYEELKSVHTKWKVEDVQLRDKICSFLSRKLVPRYKDFLGKINCSSENDKKNIKYSALEFEELISEKLFRCN